jgi:hydroxyacyl-ACP dehydratase HTD2-like protein with hotdog domain
LNVPELRFSWTRLDLFRFSAATGNAHRIHYDVEHARAEGLDSVVVHTTLHAVMLWRTLTAAVDEAKVRSFAWRNHVPLVADRAVVVRGQAERHEGGWRVTLAEHAIDDDTLVASGEALVDDEAYDG